MKNILWLIAVLLLTLPVFAGNAQADPVGTITYAEGRVDRAMTGTQSYFPSVVGEAVSVGDLVRTKSYSKAEISFADGSVVKVGANSHVQIQAYAINSKGSRTQGVIRLDRGKARIIVSKADDKSPFEIVTPNSSGSVKGSDIFVSYQKSATSVMVDEGVFKTINPAFPDRAVEVEKGKTAVIPYNGPPLEPRQFTDAEKNSFVTSTGAGINVSNADFQNREEIRATAAKVAGGVRIQRHGSTEWNTVTANEILNPGDKIETGPDGRVEISLDNGHVLELRPKTQLMIKRLSRNPATGAYENYFESELGRIRAKLQKVRKDSVFLIKTPTSTCGVRGTIMYLVIMPQLTQAFFEGGDGFVNNLASSVTKTIHAGMSTSSDAQGNVSDPVETNSQQRGEFNSDWGSDQASDSEYGYSEPDQGGDTGTGDQTGGQGTNQNGNEFNNGNSGDGGNNGDNLVPQDPEDYNNSGGNAPPPEPPVQLTLNSEGRFGNFDSLLGEGEEESSHTIIGNIVADVEDKEWSGVSLASVNGTYSANDGQTLWSSDMEGRGTDGGAAKGFAAGTWHSWDMLIANLFIDPSGVAGFILGYLSGPANDGVLSGSGNIYFTPVEPTSIIAENLFSSVAKDPVLLGGFSAIFSEAGVRLDADYKIQRMHLTDAAWGVWRAFYRGNYQNTDQATSWAGISGGGIFCENGYSWGVMTGTDNLNGKLYLNEITNHLNLDYFSFYTGDITGNYSEGYEGMMTFEGAGAGFYQRKLLTLNATVGQGVDGEKLPNADGLYYLGEEGLAQTNSAVEGYLGGGESPWEGSAPFVGMGMYEPNEGPATYLWNTNFTSFKGMTDEWSTPDGAGFFGLLAGAWIDQDINGLGVALYLDAEGNIGYLTTTFGGIYNENVRRWMVSGNFDSERKISVEDITPQEFADAIIEQPPINAQLFGSFGGTGIIEGNAEGYSYLLSEELIPETLGIFNFTFGIGAANEYYDKPADGTEWSAVLGRVDYSSGYNYFIGHISNGTWDSELLTADFTATHLTYDSLSTFDGQLIGINDVGLTSGYWGAAAVGTVRVDPLQFTGLWGDGEGSLYWNDDGSYSYGGSEQGLIGGLVSPWGTAPSEFVAIGEFSASEKNESYLWNTHVESFDGHQESKTTIDGGAFYGDTVGAWAGDGMEGVLYGIYMAPDGNAGFLKADVTGEYYEKLGMWMAGGLLTAIPVERIHDLLPDAFVASVVVEAFGDFVINGFFGKDQGFISGASNQGQYYRGTEDLSWGIKNLRFDAENSYFNPGTATVWSGVIGQTEGDRPYSDGYRLYRVSGTWENGNVHGDLTGTELTAERLVRLSGDFFGIYDETGDGGGTWIGAAIGTSVDEMLAFNGLWGGGNGSDGALYQNKDGMITQVGVSYGMIGAVNSPWEQSEPFLAMGKYSKPEGINSFLWNTTFESPRNQSTTLDGGAFWGYSAGIWKDYVMRGLAVTFFIDAEGNAGYLTGNMDGFYSQELGQWSAEGILTPTVKATELELQPSDLESLIRPSTRIDFNLSGNFDGAGSITGGGDGYFRYISDGESSLPFWIMNFSFGNNNVYVSKPENTEIWSAAFGGSDNSDSINYVIGNITDGSWKNGELSAKLNGRQLTSDYLVTFEGDLLGIENGIYEPEMQTYSGDWIATSLGVAQRESLTFTGITGIEGDSIYCNQGGDLANAGSDSGLIGGVQSPWHAPSDFVAMGTYELYPEVSEPLLWGTTVQSFNAPAESHVTPDGGAFGGWIVSVWRDGSIYGYLNALYLDGEGNLGILHSDVNGAYYPGIGMWSVDGVLNTQIKNSGMEEMELTPDNFLDALYISRHKIQGNYGGFSDGGLLQGTVFQEALDISEAMDMGWGIWSNVMFGKYQQVESTQWQLPFSGRDWNNDDPESRGPYLMGKIEGSNWNDGRLSGELKAIWLDAPHADFNPQREKYEIKINIGHATGEVTGSYEIEGEDWQAVGAGEWVEDSQIIDMTDLNDLTQKLIDAGNLVNVPVSEVYSLSALTGNGGFNGGGLMSAVLDMQMYAPTQNLANEGIWGAVIRDGAFTGPTSSDWALEFVSGNDKIQFDGSRWENNQWAADVSGLVNGNNIVGTAKGEYVQQESGGTFNGVATGQWQKPVEETVPQV